MTQLEKHLDYFTNVAEYPTDVVDAPKDATSFDKMLVVYLDDTKRMVWKVSFYNSKNDEFVRHY